VRRQSTEPVDMFHGHIGGLDHLARALVAAAAMIEDGKLDEFVEQRYARWSEAAGQKIFAKDVSLASIADAAVAANIQPKPASGRQEYLENLVSRFV
jgi:xylose isomerase